MEVTELGREKARYSKEEKVGRLRCSWVMDRDFL